MMRAVNPTADAHPLPTPPQLGLPVLYSFRRCPYAMRARMALAACGVAVELREVVLRDKPASLRVVSPKATVPVLVLPDGTVIDQSLAIMDWALGHPGAPAWHGPDAASQQAMQALVAENDGAFKQALDRYKYPERHPEHPRADVYAQGVRWLQGLDARLQHGPWLWGAQPLLADVAVFPFVRQWAAVDAQAWEAGPWPRLRTWLAACQALPWWDTAMVRPAPWEDGTAGVRWPANR
ncbi:glutathione S-transferase [Acidovorax lacteus]|uniref:Glutathione S-transferase n=1 Tax=Acidovorax lacteus TaxID=1924988 RepID=A0ABP8L4G3_9BURK